MPQSTPDENDWPIISDELMEVLATYKRNAQVRPSDISPITTEHIIVTGYLAELSRKDEIRNRFFQKDFDQTRVPVVVYIDADGNLTDASDTRPNIRREVIGEAFVNDGEITAKLGPDLGSKVLDTLYDVRNQHLSLGFAPPPDTTKKRSTLD